MKHIRIALIIAMVMSFAVLATAQNTVKVAKLDNGGKLIAVTQLVTTTATVNSPAFTLDGFLENTSSYPIYLTYALDSTDINSAKEVDSASVVLQGSNDPAATSASFATVDTVSLTLGKTTATTTSYDLNGKKFAFWRFQSIGKGSNTASIFTGNIYLYRRDH